ncbi:hypothetical protein P7C70_g1257, partial [Phenoliferia sp. Uapishka_3]
MSPLTQESLTSASSALSLKRSATSHLDEPGPLRPINKPPTHLFVIIEAIEFECKPGVKVLGTCRNLDGAIALAKASTKAREQDGVVVKDGKRVYQIGEVKVEKWKIFLDKDDSTTLATIPISQNLFNKENKPVSSVSAATQTSHLPSSVPLVYTVIYRAEDYYGDDKVDKMCVLPYNSQTFPLLTLE